MAFKNAEMSYPVQQMKPVPCDSYSSPAPAGSDVSIWTYLKILRRRKRLILTAALLGLVGALVYSLAQEPVYQAKTLVEVLGANDNFLNIREVSPIDFGRESALDSHIQTQIELIQNEVTIRRVLRRLEASNEDRELPGKATLPVQKWLQSKQPDWQQPRKISAEQALLRLTVRAVPSTRLIRITYDSADPVFAARFANSVSDELAQINIESRLAGTKRTNEWLGGQVESVRKNLENAENGLNAYARSAGLLMSADLESVDQRALRELQEELSKAQAERLMKQSQLNAVRSSKPEWLPQVADNPTLQTYQLKLTELRRQLAELNALYTPAYYKIRQVQAQIIEMESTVQRETVTVQKRIQNEYDTALSREKMLEAAYVARNEKLNEQSAKMVHYLTLKREVDTSRAFHGALTQRLREANIASAISPNDVRVAIPAAIPHQSYKPQTKLNTILGLFVGLLVGVAAIILVEQADRSLKVPGEVFDYLGLPELGAIPSANYAFERLSFVKRRRGLLMLDGYSGPLELMTWRDSPSLVAESFRQTMVSVLMNLAMQPSQRVIVVTSPGEGDGKTVVSSNLGIALAGSERKVLIVDGDLRSPRLQQVFGLNTTTGLTSLLNRSEPVTESRVQETVQSTHIPNLFVMAAGPFDSDISPLLQGDRVQEVFGILRRKFDFILVDAPPAMVIADARLLSRAADGTILVLRARHTSIEVAAATRQRLLLDGVSIIGVVLNDWDPHRTDSYGQNAYQYKKQQA